MPIPDFLRSSEKIEFGDAPKVPRERRHPAPTHLPPHGRDDAQTNRDDPLSGGGGLSGRHLGLTCEEQKGDFWCWAAVAVSISRFYDQNTPWKQCTLVNRRFNVDSCCGPDANRETCDKADRLHEALRITGNYVEYIISSTEPPVSFDLVRSEIDRGRVVCTRVELAAGGHFQMITGWKSVRGVDYIMISDPIYLENEVVFSEFASRFQAPGIWNVAYITTPAHAVTGPVGFLRVSEASNVLFPLLAAGLRSIHDAEADARHRTEVDDPAALTGG